MSDALKRVGRGGAGNYISKESQTGRSDDLEAQLQAVNPNEISVASLERSGRAEGEPALVRTGRGGAGNYSNADDAERADELEAIIAASSSSFSAAGGAGGGAAATDAVAKKKKKINNTTGAGAGEGSTTSGAAPMIRGRGGAGNYAAIAEDKERERRREEERAKGDRDKVRREVEGEVDGVLRPPGKAFVHQSKVKDQEEA